MDKHALASAMAQLGAAYGRTIEPDQLRVWYGQLGKFSAAAVHDAVDEWIKTQEKFPTPTQIIMGTQAVLRRRLNEHAETHGLPEQTGQGSFDKQTSLTHARSGIAAARAALAAGKSKQTTTEKENSE